MKKIFFLVIAILITLITSQQEKEEPKERKVPKMVCKLKNKSYSSCFWYTRNSCCYKKQGCKMGTKMRKCKKIFHDMTEKKEKKRIQKELEKERKKFSHK